MGLLAKLITAFVAAVFLAVLREVGLLGSLVDSIIALGQDLLARFVLDLLVVV